MSRLALTACVLALFLALFGGVVFQANAFFFRDAAHFYYPLFQLIQREWEAGRVPLWNPYENVGQPLLGNPTSSVFYPLKALFFLPLSYPALYKAYVLVHVLLAAAAAYGMARHWGGSIEAGGVSALSYAFSATVLFQYCNVVFLCGAAWLPLVLVAADRALRLGRWPWAVGLGVVLALQVLAGDPQAAYLAGLLAAWYAAMLWWAEVRGRGRQAGDRTIEQDEDQRRGCHPRRLAMLAAAVGSAGLLAAVQVLPSVEFSRRSERAFYESPRNMFELVAGFVAEGRVDATGLLGAGPKTPHDIYQFSFGPWRLAEFLWPNVSGRQFPLNSRWIAAIPGETTVWTPSVYIGLLPLVLALSVWRAAGRDIGHRWLRWMVLLGLLGALGRFGLIWVLRQIVRADLVGRPGEAGSWGDEVGGVHWLLTALLPGYVNFRYPSKLLVFAAVGLSGLAAAGWDRAMRESAPVRRWLSAALGVSLAAAFAGWLARVWLLDWWESPGARLRTTESYYGPLDVQLAWRTLEAALLHASIVAALAWGLLRGRGGQRAGSNVGESGHRGLRRWAAPALVALVAIDLGAANRWLILTGPQSDFETLPKALEIIRGVEASRGGDELYRVFRMRFFAPWQWAESGSKDRHHEGLRWERATLAPKYGLPYGVQYAASIDTMSLYDYEFFLAPWYERRGDRQLVYYPQIGFDCWNVKYFILPRRGVDNLEHRSTWSFLFDLHGKPAPLLYPATAEEAKEAEQLDFQIVCNPDAFPRAWIVHRLEVINPVRGPGKAQRQQIMEPLLRQGQPDLRQVALVEVDDPEAVDRFQQPGAEAVGETCRILHYEPQRIELTARLKTAGMLVLAETYYPGWKAEVNGKAAPIWRVNRMMRGIGLEAGEHQIVLTYQPLSFWWGMRISAVSTLALLCAAAIAPVRRRLFSRYLPGSKAPT